MYSSQQGMGVRFPIPIRIKRSEHDESSCGIMRVVDPLMTNRSFPMPIINQVADALQDVFGAVAQRLARDTRFVQRESKLGGAHFVQTLVFTYLANPNATLEELSQTAAALGVAITPEGLTQRFTAQAATFLQEVLAAAVTRTLAADPLAIPLLERFAAVYLEDSTSIGLQDRKSTRLNSSHLVI